MTRRVLLLALALALASCAPVPRAAPAVTPPPTTLTTADRPIPQVTPGVVLTRRAADVCTPGWAGQHRRSLTTKQRAAVLAAYGYPSDQKITEWDHYLPLELGGGNGVANIWPTLSRADSQRKDRLEDHLHDGVCAGKISLTEAQSHIKTYWQFW